jgi:ribosomal protein S18 acetylase RimI-like enzyme
VIEYADSLEGVEPRQLEGFFVGWPSPPPPERHLELLRGSAAVVLARDGERVVGFVTAISDGVLSASIPLLEVLPDYQGRGIGTELMRRILARLDGLTMVDLSCDAPLEPFYARLGFQTLDRAMGIRSR